MQSTAAVEEPGGQRPRSALGLGNGHSSEADVLRPGGGRWD